MSDQASSRQSAGDSLGPAILEAARQRFLRFGPRKTTMTEIAHEAGCSRATVYAHFRSKEQLYASLLQADGDVFIDAAEGILASPGTARDRLRQVVELTRSTYARNHVLRLALAGDGEMSLDSVARAFTREAGGSYRRRATPHPRTRSCRTLVANHRL